MVRQPFSRSHRRVSSTLDIPRADAVIVAVLVDGEDVSRANLRELNGDLGRVPDRVHPGTLHSNGDIARGACRPIVVQTTQKLRCRHATHGDDESRDEYEFYQRV